MYLSRYLKIYPDPDDPGSLIIYSTKRGSMIRVTAQLLDAAHSGLLPDSHRATMIRLGMLVTDPAEELAEMHDLVKRANSRSNLFRGIVVLNLSCNLACPYCYEDEFRADQRMSDATVATLVNWTVHEHMKKGRDVELQFYGGEPLLTLQTIHAVAAPLRDTAHSLGRKFSITMTSNGTLLSRRVVEELLPYNFTKANLTLDGPPQVHDVQRPYLSGNGSFATIVDNIREVCDLIRIDLGGNYYPHNWRDFPALLDLLLDAGITPERLGFVQFFPVTPKSGSGVDLGSGCSSSCEPWLLEAVPTLHSEILKRGFKTPKPTMGACMVEFDNDLVINYDGSLFKCAAFMGWPELSIGTLEEGIRDYAVSHNLTLWQNDECLACAYLPLCFGGCRLNPLLKTGSISGVDCRKEFFDATLQKIVTSRH
jgi:uncharacterized protein